MALETLILTHPNQISKLADTLSFPMEVGATRSLWSLILKYTLGMLCREKNVTGYTTNMFLLSPWTECGKWMRGKASK